MNARQLRGPLNRGAPTLQKRARTTPQPESQPPVFSSARKTRAGSLPAPMPESDWRGVQELPPDPGAVPPPWPGRGDRTSLTDGEAERLLVQRITFGLTQSELNLAAELGYSGYLEYHLNPSAIDDSALDSKLRRYRTLKEPASIHYRRAVQGDYTPAEQLIFATAWRQAESKRQLFERMVEFWSDHFNIYLWKDACAYLKPTDDRDVIRTYALDTFPNLLMATAKSSAMLTYLDNAGSYVGNPNQNYARELLELHTLGVENYTQHDIEEVARCFTGWTVNYNTKSPNVMKFIFIPGNHDDGAKTVLGHDIPAGGGITDGEKVIELLTTDPDIAPLTARFVGRKMLRYLWGYEPPEDLIQDVVDAYMTTGGDIKEMIRAALSPSRLAEAPQKLKRPNYLVVSALRALGAAVAFPDYLAYSMYEMGQYPFYWVPPDGYPDSVGYWSGNLLPRWCMGSYLFNEQVGLRIDISDIQSAGTTEDKVEAINQKLFFGSLSASERSELEAYLSVDPENQTRVEETVALALGAPSFQWY